MRGIKILTPNGEVLWEGIPRIRYEPELTPVNEILTFQGHNGAVRTLAFSPDGSKLVSGGNDGSLKVVEVETGRELLTLDADCRVHGVAYSPDGKWIASGTTKADGPITIWNAATGQSALNIKGHKGTVECVAFTRDGKRIISGSDDKTIRIWDAFTGRETRSLEGHEATVWSVALSQDGKRIASASGDKSVIVWDAETGQQRLRLTGHSAAVFQAAFSQDGKRVVSASGDKTLRVWDATTGHELTVLKGHKAEVLSAAFSADGDYIVSGSADETVKLWDAAKAEEIITLSGHAAPVNCVTFSPNGERIASGSWDATVKIWAAPDVKSYSVQNMRVEIVRRGRGIKVASPGNLLVVNYLLKTADGKELDSTFKKGRRPFTFDLRPHTLIKAFERGVPGMRVGEIRRLTIPPGQGLRPHSILYATIPDDTTLVYEIEMLAIRPGKSPKPYAERHKRGKKPSKTAEQNRGLDGTVVKPPISPGAGM